MDHISGIIAFLSSELQDGPVMIGGIRESGGGSQFQVIIPTRRNRGRCLRGHLLVFNWQRSILPKQSGSIAGIVQPDRETG